MSRRALGRAFALAFILCAGCEPRGPEALRRGDALLQAGKPLEAVPLLERAAADLPHESRVWNRLGIALQAAGRPEGAEQAYLRALHENRNAFDVYFNLGALYVEGGKWGEAERALRAFTAAEPARATGAAWLMLGQAQWHNRSADAERSLANAAKLDANNPEVWNTIGLVMVERRRYRDAQQDFAYAVKLAPRDPAARLNLAINAHEHLKDLKTAAKYYQEYLELAPSAPNAAAVRALIQELTAVPVVPAPAGPAVRPLPLSATNPPPATNGAVATDTRPPARAAPPAKPTPAPEIVRTPGPASNPPPVAVSTPRPAVSTPSPPPPSHPSRVESKPATPVASTPKPVPPPTNPSPPAPSAISTEVVRVSDPPAPQPAKDPEPAPRAENAARPLPETNRTAAAAVPPPAPNAPEPRAAAPSQTAGEEPKPPARSFWTRVNPATWSNPVRWFRSDESKTNVTTLPPAARSGAAPRLAALPTPSAQAPTNPPPAPRPRPKPRPPEPAHYRSRITGPLVAGDHAQADQAVADAVAAVDRKDKPAALALYERAVALDPAHFAARYDLGLLALSAHDYDRALTAGEAATVLSPESADAHRLFASALQHSRYPAEAAAELEKLLALEPDDVDAHFAAAGLYARDLGDDQRARIHYQRVLVLKPGHPQAAAIQEWLNDNP